jgi:hypothetical protein
MRRFLTLVCLLCLAIPAGISISGCSRNPGENYCNGLGYGLKVTDVASIDLEPRTTGISLAFGQIYGQTYQVTTPTATTCKASLTTVKAYTWGTTNNQLVDISPAGNICAGTWNRNSGGGIADFTICSAPNPIPSTGNLPYASAYITAAASSVTSNPVQVFVHPQVTSVTLALSGTSTQQQCYSQGQLAQLDAEACYTGTNNQQQLLCAPASVTNASSPSLACSLPTVIVNGSPQTVPLSSIPSCSTAVGTLQYAVASGQVASINNITNQITAEQPGTTLITASVAGSGSSAGYFSTCPPQSIKLTLSNGNTSGTVALGTTQNLTTTITDTQGNPITGLLLNYQSTDPIDISVASAGAIAASYPGVASISAICQPSICNQAPISEIGTYGTGLSITSNPVTITTPGTASDYVWYASPGQSQYVVPVELLSGTVGSTVRLPYVPNSMVMDKLGTNLYLGSEDGLMIYSTATNSVSQQSTVAPGVVLAVSPDDQTVLVNDQVRGLFYVYSNGSSSSTTFGGLGAAAAWTPDSQTLYITDSAALNSLPQNIAAGITGHTDSLYVYNGNTGWTTFCTVYNASTCPNPFMGAQSLAITIPSVGAFFSGSSTTAHTWCPSGTVGNYSHMVFYPLGDSVPVQTDVLAATTDGQHILGAAIVGGGVTLDDIGVTIPTSVSTPSGNCPITTTGSGSSQVQTLSPLTIQNATPLQFPLNPSPGTGNVNATSINQLVASPESNLAFLTYQASSTNTNALLPYYVPGSGVSYLSLTGSAAISAPVAGAFSPDDKYFFVSTAGDNLIHYISIPASVTPSTPPTDTQQIAPNLPACTPVSSGGNDTGCTYTGSGSIVPATAIAVKPRPTT